MIHFEQQRHFQTLISYVMQFFNFHKHKYRAINKIKLIYSRRSLLAQHQARVKDIMSNLTSFQSSISAGKRALQVRFVHAS